MTIGELKEKVMALVKVPVSKESITLQDRMVDEHIKGYNKAVADVLILIEKMKKEAHGTKGTA